MKPKQRTAQCEVVSFDHSVEQRWDDDTRRWLRHNAAYWRETRLPQGIARAEEVAAALDKGEMSLAELHRAWCATYDDLLLYSGAAIHSDEKTETIRRLLDERDDVMTELFERMSKLEARGKCRS